MGTRKRPHIFCGFENRHKKSVTAVTLFCIFIFKISFTEPYIIARDIPSYRDKVESIYLAVAVDICGKKI